MYPILKYPGAKWRLASWIMNYIPQHDSYLEPYFGSGAVFFNKQKSRIETLNDLDGEVVNFFHVCRSHPDELSYRLSLTPWSREERELAYQDTPTADAIERARLFAVRCWQTYGAFPHQSNGWRLSTGKTRNGGPDNPKLWSRLPECVYEAATRLRYAQIENRPALEVIKRFDGPDVFIYADPPYLPELRTASCDAYNHEMTEEEHVELLTVMSEHSGMIALSGYDSQLYKDYLPN